MMRALILGIAALLLTAAGLADVVPRVKPSVVGITTVQTGRGLAAQLAGTGFVVADGRHVITNNHVVSAEVKTAYFVIVPTAAGVDRRVARLVEADPVHDLALLAIEGAPLPAVRLDTNDMAEEGTDIAITGFPISSALGLVRATQRGIVAAVTPNVSAGPHSSVLDAKLILTPRYEVYQLDLVAYPGNSGSPLYRASDGEVIGILNSGFVKTTKEKVLSDPSGISFAIPAKHILPLLARAGLRP